MKMIEVAPALSLPFFFLLLFSSCFSQDCPNLIPACNGTTNNVNKTAQYSIVTNSSGPGLDQRICLSSNTTDYNVLQSTLRIVPANQHQGYYCSDISLGPGACAMNESSRTILYFDTELIAGNDYGAVEVNFTRLPGSLRATFQIVYGPDGIQSLNEAQYTLQPSDPLILEWRIFGSGEVSFSHTNSNRGISLPRPGSMSTAFISQCIDPQSNGSLISPPKPLLATWNVPAANFEDEGDFSVMISNYNSSVSVTVQQTEAPTLRTTNETTVFGMIDASASIECDILYTLKAPSWYFNNVPLSGDRYTISENSLVIDNATLEDSGSYTCSASNEIGTSSLYFLLIIGSRPVITVPPFNIQARNESRVVLPCSVQGIPPPTVSWTVDSYPVTDGVDGFNIIDPVNALSIKSINATIDVKCSARNLFGAVESNTARITVTNIGTNYTSPNSPSILIDETESVTLSCPVVPSFNHSQWSKDNVNLNNNGSSSTYTVFGNRAGDSWGLYCCEISNPLLADSVDDCTVVNVVVNPMIDFQLSNASVRTGSTISFACYANTSNHVNLPLIRWNKDGVNINTNAPRVVVQTERNRVATLVIANVTLEDEGVYSCVSSNSADRANTSANLTVVDGSCSNNSLSDSTAEGNISRWTTNHPSLSDSIVAESGGEKHFTLSASSLVPNPSISQNLSLDGLGNYTLYFKCRMRSSDLSTLPVIELAPPSGPSLNVYLPFPSLTSWQWVSASINFIAESSDSVSVIMTTSQTQIEADVFFDDLCANLVQEVLAPSSISVTPSSTSTISPSTTPTTLQLLGVDYYYVVSGAGAALLLLLLLFIICCSVTICCCRKKRKSRRYRGAEDLTKSLTEELKNNGVKLQSVSTRYTNFKGPEKDMSPIEAPKESQPVYVVPGGGNAPVYLTGNTPLLPSSFGQREEVSSYEYMEATRTHSTSSRLLLTGGGGAGSPPEMVYEDPTTGPEEMYDEIVKESPEHMLYEDMKGEEEGKYNYEDMNAPAAPLPPLPSHSVQNSDGVYENPQAQSELYDNPSPPLNRPKHSYSLPSVQHKMFPTRGTEKSSSFVASAGTSKSHYMSLNPSSIEDTQVYTSPSPIPSPPPVEEEGPEYVSITNKVLDLVRERTANLDTEDDYV